MPTSESDGTSSKKAKQLPSGFCQAVVSGVPALNSCSALEYLSHWPRPGLWGIFQQGLNIVICFQEPADDEATSLCRGVQETSEPTRTDVHDDPARAPLQGEKLFMEFKKLLKLHSLF